MIIFSQILFACTFLPSRPISIYRSNHRPKEFANDNLRFGPFYVIWSRPDSSQFLWLCLIQGCKQSLQNVRQVNRYMYSFRLWLLAHVWFWCYRFGVSETYKCMGICFPACQIVSYDGTQSKHSLPSDIQA